VGPGKVGTVSREYLLAIRVVKDTQRVSVQPYSTVQVNRLTGDILGRCQVHSKLTDVLGRLGTTKRDPLEGALPPLGPAA
jgi:hypothetical protein